MSIQASISLRPAKVLTVADINGKPVTFFSPPHTAPDFPWVDVEQLAAAFLDDEAARRMVTHAQNFDRRHRSVVTAVNGDRIATIFCHAMAQGLCGAIDQWNGFAGGDDDDDGPAFKEYCLAAGITAAKHWPLDFPDMIHAFRNPGGPFLLDNEGESE